MNLLVEDAAVLMHRPDSGRSIPFNERDGVLPAALLLDLVEVGCARIISSTGVIGQKTFVEFTQAPEAMDGLLAAAMTRAQRGAAPHKAREVLIRIGQGLIGELRTRMVQRGVWREYRRRWLRVIPVRTYRPVPGYGEELRTRLHQILITGLVPTPRERALLALLTSERQLRCVVARSEVSRARGRAVELSEEESHLHLLRQLVVERSRSDDGSAAAVG